MQTLNNEQQFKIFWRIQALLKKYPHSYFKFCNPKKNNPGQLKWRRVHVSGGYVRLYRFNSLIIHLLNNYKCD